MAPSLRSVLTTAAVATVATQAAAVATVTVADSLRKRREPQSGEFPRVEPRELVVAGSPMTTYTFGADVYEAMLADIEAATETVMFETFIWKSSVVGRRFKDALLAAAQRGVEVYVIADSLGNLNNLDLRFKTWPDLPTLHVMKFPLVRPGIVLGNPRQTGRDHRKLLVVDGEIGYVGGFNIGDVYATTWRDTHLRVEGDAAWELEDAFLDFWNDHRRRRLHDLVTRRPLPAIPDHGALSWDSRVVAAANSPYRMEFPIRHLYTAALNRASSHVLISMGYFIPDKVILQDLVAAARRGVTVKVLIPEYSNHVLADWAAKPWYSDLLDAGVEIWLFQEAMIHAKTMTVDGRWTTVGTANIDRLSMTGNFEVNLEVYDEALARQMEEVFEVDLTNARRLTGEEWGRRTRAQRVLERVIRPLGPLL